MRYNLKNYYINLITISYNAIQRKAMKLPMHCH